ncbi:MAG: ribosomal protein S18-alanine N-acetyltransferase [Sulfuricellaceae bacterium]|nr:ribosomal protein S18-alanine N-acetyltransferase [Sulfuricellaceae bacterium]
MNAQLKTCVFPEAMEARPMVFADIEQVLAVEQTIYAFPWTQGNFTDSLSSGYSCWSLSSAQSLIGYGILMVAAGEGHLLNLGIAAHWQKKGLGRRLLHHLIDIAKGDGVDMMFLEVRPSNTSAINLYLSEGFNEIGLRRNYYPANGGREDAIVMGLSI